MTDNPGGLRSDEVLNRAYDDSIHAFRFATATGAGSAAATATTSRVSSSSSNVTLLTANASRKGACIVNDSTQVCYVKLGAVASSTDYTVAMAAKGTVGSYFETPFGYTGQIDAIWASANGAAQITEAI